MVKMKKRIVPVIFAVYLILTSLTMMGSSVAQMQPTEKIPVIVGFRNRPEADLIRAYDGSIKHVYSIISAVACSLPKWAIDALMKIPKVMYVEPDGTVWALDEALPWGVDRIDAEIVHPYNKGTGVKIAVIDSGIDYNHRDLDDNYKGGYDFVNHDSDPMDDNGHGTHVAGIIAAEANGIGIVGVAPKASLYALKVLDRNGGGKISDVVEAIEWSVSNGMQIISMSLGTEDDSISLRTACDNAYTAGLILVAAAGNNGPGPDTILYPAKYDSVIAVGATENNDVRAEWSSTGPQLELAAPGVGIYSTYLYGTYAILSGTSMACPHVTGAAALVLKSNEKAWFSVGYTNGDGVWTNMEVRTVLCQTADDLGTIGKDNLYGYGLVDADEAAPSTPIHVESIEMAMRTLGRRFWSLTRAEAVVTILDAGGNPVEGATVYGHWSGITSGKVYGLTDVNGRVTLKSRFLFNASGTFTFTVDDVAKEGLTYDPSANKETSDSITK